MRPKGGNLKKIILAQFFIGFAFRLMVFDNIAKAQTTDDINYVWHRNTVTREGWCVNYEYNILT
jgi:hypothetical protein